MNEDAKVRFRILGSFECWDGPDRVRIGGPVHERVLVALLLEPGRVLPVYRLVEAVWDENAPATAAHQVRKAVAELRQRIPDGRTLIVTDGPGYRAAVAPDQSDLSPFIEGLRQAREAVAAGRSADAAESLREALTLWRGPVLSDSGGSVIAAASVALEERRLTAVEQLFTMRLAAGESSELVGELREFIGAQTLRETLRGQLMLALFRSGRQGEALEEYEKVRELLAAELGIDPGDRLQELHQGILRNSPDLAIPIPAGGSAALPPLLNETRSTLPYDLRDFTGREEEMSRLLGFVEESERSGPLIVAIDGMGGSGKTSLAVRAAHQLADRYPDAQLYLDLRGFTPGEQPLSSATAAVTLLRMLGTPGKWIPDDAEGRTALWRKMTTRYRMILLLDNVVDEAQVRPLLASSVGTLILVTSRSLLVDLDATHCVSLGTMLPRDSVALVSRVLEDRRAKAEPEAVAELAELCGHLPLALRIASARLRKRPRWTVRYLVDRLRDDAQRLAELSVGERSVEVTLRLSYEGLDAENRQAFRLLGQHPASELDVYAAAALLDKGIREAEEILEHLLDMHLVQQHEAGRYVFHDLVRSFAHNLSRLVAPDRGGGRSEAADEASQEAAGAVHRLIAFCQAATDVACDLIFPGRARTERPEPDFVAELPPMRTPGQARAWFEREEDSLLAAISLAYRWGMDRQGALLAGNVVFQVDLRGRLEEFAELSRTAVVASRRLGDRVLLRLSLSNLAVADWKLGRFAEGIAVAEEAYRLALDLGDRRGEAKDTGVLGLLLSALGRFDEALPRLEQSIALKRELGAERAEAESLTNLSNLYAGWGRYTEAAQAAARAVHLARRIGADDKEIEGLTDLALAKLGLEDVEGAAAALGQARDLASGVISPADISLLLALSADAADQQGEHGQAREWAEAALEQDGLSGAPVREATVRNVIAHLYQRRGEYAMALELHREAHRAASAVGYRIQEAHALQGMAAAMEALGDVARAREHQARADEAFDAMSVPLECRIRS
jgi:DNA-binding SARP family transcriptional activator